MRKACRLGASPSAAASPLANVILGEASAEGGGRGEVRDPVYHTWVDDPAEVSMRVWAFWRQWLIDGAGQLTYWNVALRLVVGDPG